jgi:hypothetical protein
MSITEKLASLRDERLARIHACLLARDWCDGAWYDVEQGVTMDKWALMVQREMNKRVLSKKKVAQLV